MCKREGRARECTAFERLLFLSIGPFNSTSSTDTHNQTCCINNGLGCKNQPVDSNRTLFPILIMCERSENSLCAPGISERVRLPHCSTCWVCDWFSHSLSLCARATKGAKLLRSPQRCCFLPLLLIRDWSCGCRVWVGMLVCAASLN